MDRRIIDNRLSDLVDLRQKKLKALSETTESLYGHDTAIMSLLDAHRMNDFPTLAKTAEIVVPRLSDDYDLMNPFMLAMTRLALNNDYAGDAIKIAKLVRALMPAPHPILTIAFTFADSAELSILSPTSPHGLTPEKAYHLAKTAAGLIPTEFELNTMYAEHLGPQARQFNTEVQELKSRTHALVTASAPYRHSPKKFPGSNLSAG